MGRYENMLDFLIAIGEHIKINGGHLITNDFPKLLTMGFYCTQTNKEFLLPISKLDISFLENSNNSSLNDLKLKFSNFSNKKDILLWINCIDNYNQLLNLKAFK